MIIYCTYEHILILYIYIYVFSGWWTRTIPCLPQDSPLSHPNGAIFRHAELKKQCILQAGECGTNNAIMVNKPTHLGNVLYVCYNHL